MGPSAMTVLGQARSVELRNLVLFQGTIQRTAGELHHGQYYTIRSPFIAIMHRGGCLSQGQEILLVIIL